jgi:hypothetical protein
VRYFVDTEFVDDGKTIDLISVGIVAEDGREYYAQSLEVDARHIDNWLFENVLSHMQACDRDVFNDAERALSVLASMGRHRYGHLSCTSSDCPWRTRQQLMYEVAQFVQPDGEHTPFELWGWCAGYDFVVLCQLFGKMMYLPLGWPHYIRDLQYLLDERGIKDEDLPKQAETAHNALADARQIKRIWDEVL